jgi:hypothetical protein
VPFVVNKIIIYDLSFPRKLVLSVVEWAKIQSCLINQPIIPMLCFCHFDRRAAMLLEVEKSVKLSLRGPQRRSNLIFYKYFLPINLTSPLPLSRLISVLLHLTITQILNYLEKSVIKIFKVFLHGIHWQKFFLEYYPRRTGCGHTTSAA